MRQTHDQIAADIRRLFETLAPYGIRRPSQLAALMREDGDTWPSDAYIRLMSGAKGPDPSERFCDRFHALADHVYAALASDGDVVALVRAAVNAPDSYDPAAHVRFVPIPPNVVIHPSWLADGTPGLTLALVPEELIGHCQHDACGKPFPKRVPWQRFCCPAHARAARKHRVLVEAAEDWLAVETSIVKEARGA